MRQAQTSTDYEVVMRAWVNGELYPNRTPSRRVTWRGASNKGDRVCSVFFEGDKIYSYGHHWVMARCIANKGYLVNTTPSTVTTKRHTWTLQSVIGHRDIVSVELDSTDLQSMPDDELLQLALDWKRAEVWRLWKAVWRKRTSWRRDWAISNTRDSMEQYRSLCDWVGRVSEFEGAEALIGNRLEYEVWRTVAA